MTDKAPSPADRQAVALERLAGVVDELLDLQVKSRNERSALRESQSANRKSPYGRDLEMGAWDLDRAAVWLTLLRMRGMEHFRRVPARFYTEDSAGDTAAGVERVRVAIVKCPCGQEIIVERERECECGRYYVYFARGHQRETFSTPGLTGPLLVTNSPIDRAEEPLPDRS